MNDSESAEIDLKELIYSECKALEITAKKFADASITGAYKSLKKGTGIEFEEARVYTPSDDARRIDWKVTARKQKPYIKSFREEQDQSILLVVDGTYSTLLGIESAKSRKILEISAFIGSIASFNHDNIGSLIFGGPALSYNKARRGFSAVYKILYDILSLTHAARHPTKTDSSLNSVETPEFSETLLNISRMVKRKSQIFIISDFNFNLNFDSALKALSTKHDLFCISVQDALETELPTTGTYLVKNPENGEESVIDFSNKKTRAAITNAIKDHQIQLEKTFKRQRVPFLSVSTKTNIRLELFSFFREQARAHG